MTEWARRALFKAMNFLKGINLPDSVEVRRPVPQINDLFASPSADVYIVGSI